MTAFLRRRFLLPGAVVVAVGMMALQGVRAEDHENGNGNGNDNGDDPGALAAQPLTYQGRIFADLEPIPTDTYEVTVELFGDEDADERLCGESNETMVVGGFFNMTLHDPACAASLRLPRSAVWVRVMASGGVFGDRDVVVGMHRVSTGVFALHAQSGGGTIGDIVPSMLTEGQFQALRGAGWVLADGSAHEGSLYAQITGSATVPDLRGVFLRGKDHGRFAADGVGNPAGDLALGDYQADELRRHHHAVHPVAGVDDGEDPGPEVSATDLTVREGRTSGYGGDETRPQNVTVNYFIKIN